MLLDLSKPVVVLRKAGEGRGSEQMYEEQGLLLWFIFLCSVLILDSWCILHKANHWLWTPWRSQCKKQVWKKKKDILKKRSHITWNSPSILPPSSVFPTSRDCAPVWLLPKKWKQINKNKTNAKYLYRVLRDCVHPLSCYSIERNTYSYWSKHSIVFRFIWFFFFFGFGDPISPAVKMRAWFIGGVCRVRTVFPRLYKNKREEELSRRTSLSRIIPWDYHTTQSLWFPFHLAMFCSFFLFVFSPPTWMFSFHFSALFSL